MLPPYLLGVRYDCGRAPTSEKVRPGGPPALLLPPNKVSAGFLRDFLKAFHPQPHLSPPHPHGAWSCSLHQAFSDSHLTLARQSLPVLPSSKGPPHCNSMTSLHTVSFLRPLPHARALGCPLFTTLLQLSMQCLKFSISPSVQGRTLPSSTPSSTFQAPPVRIPDSLSPLLLCRVLFSLKVTYGVWHWLLCCWPLPQLPDTHPAPAMPTGFSPKPLTFPRALLVCPQHTTLWRVFACSFPPFPA